VRGLIAIAWEGVLFEPAVGDYGLVLPRVRVVFEDLIGDAIAGSFVAKFVVAVAQKREIAELVAVGRLLQPLQVLGDSFANRSVAGGWDRLEFQVPKHGPKLLIGGAGCRFESGAQQGGVPADLFRGQV
jgi:hypothetical protein